MTHLPPPTKILQAITHPRVSHPNFTNIFYRDKPLFKSFPSFSGVSRPQCPSYAPIHIPSLLSPNIYHKNTSLNFHRKVNIALKMSQSTVKLKIYHLLYAATLKHSFMSFKYKSSKLI